MQEALYPACLSVSAATKLTVFRSFALGTSVLLRLFLGILGRGYFCLSICVGAMGTSVLGQRGLYSCFGKGNDCFGTG